MKSIFRVPVLILSIAVVLSTAGCTSKAPAKSTASENQTSSPTAAGKVKITYSQWGTVDESSALTKAIKNYQASQDKIEIEVITAPWETYMTKLNTMATAGQLPDTGLMSEAGVLQFASQSMLADVSKMYDGSDSKPLDSLAFKYQGKTVAYSAANECLLLYYNKDMFDKAGVAYPPVSADKAWTWDQFVDTSKKLTLDNSGKHPGDSGFNAQSIKQFGCLVENLPWQLETWAVSNGGGYYNKDGSKTLINEPASIEAIQKVADLYLKEHVAPLSTGASDDSIQRSLINKTCAMGTGGAWNVGSCLADAKKQGLNYGVAVLPYMKDKVTLCTGGPNVVFNQTKHQKEAMEWLKWYTKEENSWQLISDGIWMPVLEKWYTDEKLTHKWVDNPNFPPYADYKAAVVDYARDMKIARPASWYYVNNTVDFNNLLNSILGDVWTGKTTAKDAISKNIDKLNSAYQGKK